MSSPRTFFGLTPDHLLACASECRLVAARQPSTPLAERMLRLASQYEALADRLGGPTQSPEKTISVWERRGRTFVARAEAECGTVELFVIVDPKRNRKWHWSVWRPGGMPVRLGSGVEAVVQDAMREAEHAARAS